MLIFDEQLGDVLDEPNARRGFWLDVRQAQDQALFSEQEGIVMAAAEAIGRYAGEHFYDSLMEA